jgi:hypothetical protein
MNFESASFCQNSGAWKRVSQSKLPGWAGGAPVNAVGDVADRHLLDRFIRKERMPHVTAHPPVEFADGVGGARELQGEHRHAKRLGHGGGIDPAQAHEFGKRHAEPLAEIVQGILHEAGAEPVVAGLDGRVGREDALGPGQAQRLLEIFSFRHLFADQLERQEGCMALVHVEHRRFDA